MTFRPGHLRHVSKLLVIAAQAVAALADMQQPAANRTRPGTTTPRRVAARQTPRSLTGRAR